MSNGVKREQLSLFDVVNTTNSPKVKVQKCNQLECTNNVTLTFDEQQGIYVGFRACYDCRRSTKFKFAEYL